MKNRMFLKIQQYLRQYRPYNWLKITKHAVLKKKNLDTTGKTLDNANYVAIEWPRNIKKPYIGIVKDYLEEMYPPPHAYWTRFKRYLEYNKIPYSFYDIDCSDWIDEAKKYDIIVWHTLSQPADQMIAKPKIYFLEKYLKKKCYPCFNEIWHYEDKIRQQYLFKHFNLPSIQTFITNNKNEALLYANNADYPIVSKIATGSGSLGVDIIKTKREAKRYINKVFSIGQRNYWTYLKQKDYIYFQKFINDAQYDLRIIGVGNKFFGYYRLKPKSDFRASGSGLYEKKKIPQDALLLAKKVKDCLKATMLAVDVLKSESSGEYQIIEISIFFQINTPEQLKIDNVAGYYEFYKGNFEFKTGRYWLQELALHEILLEWLKRV